MLKNNLFSILLVAAFFLPLHTASAEHALDGKSYVVEVTKEGEELFTNENIEFADGKMETTFKEDEGYNKADYETSKEGETIHFKATSTNKEGDSLTWNGSESDGVLQGTIALKSAKNSAASWSFKSAAR
ncbi:MAG: hypothetical protein J5J00_11155 [Deltaproteobacteria bacterium]|nr:hypothetical protein [Deltaproteobacteria bacterium]